DARQADKGEVDLVTGGFAFRHGVVEAVIDILLEEIFEGLAIALGVGGEDHLISLLGAFEERLGRKRRISLADRLEAGRDGRIAVRELLHLAVELALARLGIEAARIDGPGSTGNNVFLERALGRAAGFRRTLTANAGAEHLPQTEQHDDGDTDDDEGWYVEKLVHRTHWAVDVEPEPRAVAIHEACLYIGKAVPETSSRLIEGRRTARSGLQRRRRNQDDRTFSLLRAAARTYRRDRCFRAGRAVDRLLAGAGGHSAAIAGWRRDHEPAGVFAGGRDPHDHRGGAHAGTGAGRCHAGRRRRVAGGGAGLFPRRARAAAADPPAPARFFPVAGAPDGNRAGGPGGPA